MRHESLITAVVVILVATMLLTGILVQLYHYYDSELPYLNTFALRKNPSTLSETILFLNQSKSIAHPAKEPIKSVPLRRSLSESDLASPKHSFLPKELDGPFGSWSAAEDSDNGNFLKNDIEECLNSEEYSDN